MNKVNEINYRRLNNGDFYQFIENIVNIVKNEPLALSTITKLQEDLSALQNSFKKEQLTEDTKKIVALDILRDRAFLKLKGLIESYGYDDENIDNKKASQDLEALIKLYGNGKLIKFDYNKETASITNFITDTRSKYNAQINQLGLMSTLNYLETCNTNFKDFYASRNDAATQLANIKPFTRLRLEVNEHYKIFTTDVESLQRFLPDNAPQISNLIARINVEIDKFKLLVPTKTTTPPAI